MCLLASLTVEGQIPHKFRHLTTANGLPDNGISALCVDSRGLVWIGTDAGLACYDGYEVTTYLEYTDDDGTHPLGGVYGIKEEADGGLLLNVGMYPMRFDPKEHRIVSTGKDKIARSSESRYTDLQGTQWRYYFDNDRLEYLPKGGSWQTITLSGDAKTNNAVRGLADDGQGQLWIATDHQGLYRYRRSDGMLTNYRRQGNEPWNLPSDNVNCVAADRQGTVWLGDYKQGVSFWNPVFDMLTLNSIECGDVSALLMDSRRTLWIGTDGRGLYSEGKGEHARKTAMPDVVVTSLREDARGRIWVGTYGNGLYKIEKLKDLKIEKVKAVGDRKVASLAIDGEGKVWICSAFDPLACYDPATGECHEVRNEQGYDILGLATASDPEGRVLIGSYYGLYRIDPKTGRQEVFYGAGNREFLGQQSIALLADSHGTLWMGHSNGLTVWDTKTDSLTRLTADDGGLTPGRVRSLIEDGEGRVMVVTAGGLSVITREKGGLWVKACRFADMDANYVLNPNSTTLLPEGNPIFGTTNGYAVLHQQLLNGFGNKTPQVGFSGISVSGRQEDESAEVIRIGHDDYNIVFKLYIDRIFEASQAHYEYRLKGLKDKWIQTNQHIVNFASLPPGTYTFEARACTESGKWSEPRSVRVEVSPSLWASLPMKVLYIALLLALGLWGLHRYKQRQRQKLEQERHEIEQENMVRLADAKLRFFTNVSHDLRTPLTLILSPLQMLMKEPLPEKVRKNIALIDKNAQQLMAQVNTLLDFRRIDVGAERLNASQDNLVAFLRKTCEEFEPYAKDRSISLTYTPGEESIIASFDADKLHKILYNLLSNAFKFTPEGGSITLSIKADDSGKAVISVADTGIGITDEAKLHVFERFYQAHTDEQHPGSGIGLHIVQEYVRLHGGEIGVSDNVPQGTVFSFTLPVGNEKSKINNEKVKAVSDTDVDANCQISTVNSQIPTILMVDDNRDLCQFVADSLSEEYRVLTAYDGQEALDTLQREDATLVVSDVMMPRMNGLELCNRIKQDIQLSHIPVLLLTAKTAEASVIEGLQMGADDYLTKPFSIDVLRLRIQKFIEWTRRAHQAFQQKIDVEPGEITITPIDKEFIAKAIKVVEDHLRDSEFSVEVLASEMAMNRVSLWRKIQNLTGMGPGDFIKTIRLKRGKQLLEQTDKQVSEIAYEVGYNTVKRFTENFKQEYGATPSEYRKQNKDRKNEQKS